MKKLLPNFTDEMLDEIALAVNVKPTDFITDQEFELMFDPVNMSKRQGFPKLSAVKMQNQKAAKDAKQDEYNAILKYLAECLASDHQTAKQFFSQADKTYAKALRV